MYDISIARILAICLAIIFVTIKCLPLHWPKWFYGSSVGVGIALIGLSERYRLLLAAPSLNQLVLSIAAGCALFCASMGIAYWPSRVTLAWLSPERLGSLFNRRTLRDALWYSVVALYEELVWRAALPFLCGNSLVAVVCVACMFSLSHLLHTRSNLPQRVEFVGFSLVLGIGFWLTNSIWMVMLVHLLRDVLIGVDRRARKVQLSAHSAEPLKG